jgi:uncharacterized protein (TIGR03437 family)
MRFAGFTLALAGIFAGNALGQAPTVGGLLNNYSNTLPGLPNYGIAEGSIFVIYGTNFSPSNVSASLPLESTLNGVTINVTVNGTITHPLFYYLFPSQIGAVLPSATPVGTGTITVTTSAGTSADFPIQVVASAFGLLTTNNGAGPVQGYDASINASNQYTLFGFSEAANPGDILELWGTGLGPVTGDATGVSVTPMAQVFIGGIAAGVQYAGRSGFTGLDQINVVVPAGVSGCYVSVVVQTGNYVSNFATLPVAAKGSRTCSDTSNLLSTSLLNELAQKGTLNIGSVGLNKSTTPGTMVGGITVGGGTTDSGSATFLKLTSAQLTQGVSVSGASASIGSCVVSFFYSNHITVPSFTTLNAGPDVNITGPDGAIAMPLQTEPGFSFYTTPSSDKSFIPASGGSFTFDNGSGGPDVGAFTASLTMAAPVTWTNMNSISTVTRANGVTVNWTGGDPSTYVNISGLSLGSLSGSSTVFVAADFTCQAPTSAGTFTVPPVVLLELPPSFTIAGISTSSLSVSNVTGPATFTATGLDVGWVEASVENTIMVTYQ